MLIRLSAVAVLGTALISVLASGPAECEIRTEMLNNKYPENMKSALRRFEQEVLRQRRGGGASSRKPLKLGGVIMGKYVSGQASTTGGGSAGHFTGVDGLSVEQEVIEYQSGEPSSHKELQGAVRRFVTAAGPGSPCVRRCKARETRCMTTCRRVRRTKRIGGRCTCIHILARCLIQGAERGTCHPPTPIKRLRRR